MDYEPDKSIRITLTTEDKFHVRTVMGEVVEEKVVAYRANVYDEVHDFLDKLIGQSP
jgi:hypothetical protein